MSDNLKPCPLCGADAEMHYEKLCGTTIYMVKCSADKCQCQEMGWHETETDATNVWNTRPIDDALQARIAELEAEVIQYMAELDRVLEAHKKAITRLNEWNPELAQDFVTLLLMDLQKKE
jgi:hypothetical protein